jgi:hypothetical protein
MGKYLRIDDREALEDVYRLYKAIYPQIPHLRRGDSDTAHVDGRKDPRAKAAKPEQFIDGTILREIEKSGFLQKLSQQK